MPLPSLRTALATPLNAPHALPMAAALGAGVGGGVAALMQGITNALPGTGFGALLGMLCAGTQQVLEARSRQHQIQPHERALVEYPSVRALLERAGRTHHDADALRRLSAQLSEHFGRLSERFNEYCALRGLAPNPLMAQVIRHFYLTHCGDRGVVLISKRSMRACYLVAANSDQQPGIVAAMNEAAAPVGTVLRRLRCAYLRVDLANECLRDAQNFTTQVKAGEWVVHPVAAQPGDTVETLQPTPTVRAVHRRVGRSRVTHTDARAAAHEVTSAASSAGPISIQRGQVLRHTLAGLPAGSRTWRELNRIEADLAANRPCGHLVCYQGTDYIAIDIHWDGRRSPGRNAWRLLVQRVPAGYLLYDIVNYH